MPKYVVDTNLYIRATRDDEWARALERFLFAARPALYLHSVVALELLAGATSEPMRRLVEKSIVRPFERRNRVCTPTHEAWKRAAGALAGLVRDRRVSREEGIRKSLVNDSLIAASARDYGFVLVTDNTRDFAMLNEYLPLQFDAPWPLPII